MNYDIVILGGGLAGLTAAIEAARAGRSVAVVERSTRLGGRAISVKKKGAIFNLGGHALYRGGAAKPILEEYGVKLPGGKPAIKVSAIWNGRVMPMPGDPVGLLTSPLLPAGGKLSLIRLLVKIMGSEPGKAASISLREWAEREIADPMVRHLFYSLCRTATYAHDPDYQLAGVALVQVKRALVSGVHYVDGGWQTIVDQLAAIADRAGVAAYCGKHAARIEQEAGAVRRIVCTDGTALEASGVISTLSPSETYRIVDQADQTSLKRWMEEARPVTAACLDVNLRKLPVPGRNVAMGIDQPVFYSNHSNSAKLSDDGSLVIHLMKYKRPGEASSADDERLLEQTLGLLHPGWEQEVISKQFMPNLTVVHDHPHLGRTQADIPSAVAGLHGLYVAGDWVNGGDLLADAAVASGRRAAQLAVKELKNVPPSLNLIAR